MCFFLYIHILFWSENCFAFFFFHVYSILFYQYARKLLFVKLRRYPIKNLIYILMGNGNKSAGVSPLCRGPGFFACTSFVCLGCLLRLSPSPFSFASLLRLSPSLISFVSLLCLYPSPLSFASLLRLSPSPLSFASSLLFCAPSCLSINTYMHS